MKKPASNIISDWLYKYGDPAISEQVRKEAEILNRLNEEKMGMYIYVTEQNVKEMSSVNDPELNLLLQEARKIDDRILVSEEYQYNRKKGYRGWLIGEKEKTFRYQLYLESRAHDGSPYQAQYCMCASNYRTVFSYLCGVINGGAKESPKQEVELPYSKESIHAIVLANQECYGHEFAAGMEKAFTIVNARIMSKSGK